MTLLSCAGFAAAALFSWLSVLVLFMGQGLTTATSRTSQNVPKPKRPQTKTYPSQNVPKRERVQTKHPLVYSQSVVSVKAVTIEFYLKLFHGLNV